MGNRSRLPLRFPQRGETNVKITAKTVSTAQLPKGKLDTIYFDDVLRGFGLRLRISGGRLHRSYCVQYKRGGSTRRLLLGSAEVLSADQARSAAKEALAKVALGGDPQGEKVAERNRAPEHSLKAVVDEYLAAKRKSLRPNTYRASVSYLAGSLYFAPLHRMPINEIKRRDVAARLAAITRELGPIPAAAARGKLSACFVWAMQMGLAEHNPVVGTLQPEGGQSRERVLEDGEIAAIWRACGDHHFGKITKLLLLTGCRRAEVGGMQWPELNMDTGSWTIPAQRAKNGRAHTLMLPPAAMEIIRSVPHLVGRDHLFGQHCADGFSAWGLGKRGLDEKLGDRVAAWTLHDLRRSVATKMADIGIQPHIIEAVLNHQSGHKGGVAGIYNRSSYAAETKTALLRWSAHLNDLVAGTRSNVVQLGA